MDAESFRGKARRMHKRLRAEGGKEADLGMRYNGGTLAVAHNLSTARPDFARLATRTAGLGHDSDAIRPEPKLPNAKAASQDQPERCPQPQTFRKRRKIPGAKRQPLSHAAAEVHLFSTAMNLPHLLCQGQILPHGRADLHRNQQTLDKLRCYHAPPGVTFKQRGARR